MSYYTVGFLVMIFFKEDTDRAGLWGEKIENKIPKFTSGNKLWTLLIQSV